ncbi:host specificity factor TipJ family phage tail protein [Sporomusa termitida]|uniref:Fibronectin type-III domain-containing protein n=1 Tax=Sporomusa termitida TaxID=2377 RepID=A0A517DVI6_9FIRM|nr:host specificity factor TipJ family phage tail protein [Sporomusa termitida]QDR81337.1 hypothetical protein SPTER_27160 [Sporomusa termitida]
MKLIFVRNPIAPDKRDIRQLEAKATVAEHIAPILREWPDTVFSVSVNGHLLEIEEWDTLVPGDDDSVVVHPVLAKGISNFFRAIVSVALMSYVGGVFGKLGGNPFWKSVFTAVGQYVGGRIASAILPPPKQEEQQQSSTYGWSGPRPTAKPGTPVAKTYGTVRIAPVLLARYVTSDGSNQYLNLLYSGGEGPVDSIDNIFIDGNPIGNYVNVTYDTRLGTNDQTPIANFNDTITDFQLGYELNTEGDWATEQTVGTAVQGLQITVQFPYGLARVKDDGGLGTATVTVAAQYRLVGDSTWQEWTLTNGGTTSDAKNTSIWTTYRLDNVRPGQYVVRVRCAKKSGTSTRDITRVFWTMLSTILYDDFAYPNRVLVGIRALATNQLSNSDPVVTWEQTRSTVYVWNPNINEYQTERASNPYWASYDLIHQCKYLMNINTGQYEYFIDGNPAGRIDYSAFAAAAAYADQLLENGDYRFSLNIYLSENLSFWDALARFSIVGRGVIIPKGTLYSCICDRPSEPVQLFTVGNITAKSFKGEFQSTKDRATSVEVTFYNKQKDYSTDQAIYYGPNYELTAMAANPVQTTYYGITDYRHAYTEAAYLSRCNQYLIRTEHLEADIDAMACTLGDVVDVQHDIPKWGDAGGRIVSATETTVTLDKKVTLLARYSYAIKIRLYTDQIIQVSVRSYAQDTTTSTLTVTEPFPVVPKKYDVYAFGRSNIVTKPFKIVNIAKNGDQKVKITGIEYIEAVYEETIDAPVLQYSDHERSLVEVATVSTNQETYLQPDGTTVSVLHVSWPVPSGYVQGYSVWYSSDGGSTWLLWESGIRSAGTTITGVKALVTYIVKVSTLNDIGMVSPGVISEPLYITGKITPPANVAGFIYREVSGGFLLSWQANTEIDLDGYNIFQGANNATMDSSVLIAERIMGTSLFVPIAQAGLYSFHIVAFDSSGNASATPATLLASFAVPPDVTGFDVVRVGDHLDFLWQAIAGAGTTYTYEIRRGANWNVGQRIGKTTSPYYNCLFPTPGDHHFWLKAIDGYGNYSVNAVNAQVIIVDAGNRNAVITVNQVANGWIGASLNTYVRDGGLQLADGAVRGQHIVEVSLPKSFTARNTILANMVGVTYSGITWESASFTWDDMEALTPWETDGDITGITLDHQISLYKGIPPGIIESIPLDGTVSGDLGTPAREAANVTYGSGRFRRGAFIQDATQLSWDINIPSIYNVVFYVSVAEPIVDNAVYLTLAGPEGRLMAGYDRNKDVFYLEDQLGQRNETAVEYKDIDWLTFGLVQTQTTRKLYVYSFSANAARSSEEVYGPVGSFTAAFLYPKCN